MIETSDVGRMVVCDFCDEDYTNSPATGGLLFESKAVCPKCAERTLRDAKKHNEEHFIHAICPEGMAFADWVRNWLRGGKSARITLMTGPDAEKAMGLTEEQTPPFP